MAPSSASATQTRAHAAVSASFLFFFRAPCSSKHGHPLRMQVPPVGLASRDYFWGFFLLLLSAHACRRLTRQVWLQETDATSRPMIKSDLAHFGLCVHWTGFHIGHLPPAQLISGFLVLDMVTLSILIRVGIHFRYVFSFLSVNGPWPKAK